MSVTSCGIPIPSRILCLFSIVSIHLCIVYAYHELDYYTIRNIICALDGSISATIETHMMKT